jgi:2-C-methyl-D-erythritol 4-phosphate cytidylyltransferase
MGAAVPKVLLKPSSDQGIELPSILEQTVATFHADLRCECLVVCVPEEWRQDFTERLDSFSRVLIVPGGETRQESVFRGLKALEISKMITEEMIVLVHDAARCCVTQEVIDRVVAGVINHGAVTAAVPVVDSLCRARDGVIQGYVDRTDAWAIQTPQGFVATDLMKAHTAAREEGTQALDDAALVATFRPVHIVQGDRFNIKVTQPEDLSVAGSIVGRR